jgi:hypothetical protein
MNLSNDNNLARTNRLGLDTKLDKIFGDVEYVIESNETFKFHADLRWSVIRFVITYQLIKRSSGCVVNKN